MRKVYLDHAAATPLDPEVLELMKPYFAEEFYNPSAMYSASTKVRKVLNEALAKLAKCLEVKASEIVLTSGGTEANNLAIHGVMEQYPGAKLLVSAVEHESVLMPAEKYDHSVIPVDEHGVVDLKKLKSMFNDSVALVSVMQANNEVGSIQPLAKIGKIFDEVKKDRKKRGVETPLYLHSDSCQAPQYLDVHPNRLGVDLLTLNSGKIYGPKQTGLLYVDSKVHLQPQITGGGQQRGLRSGTENVANAVGFAAALEKATNSRKQETVRMGELQRIFAEGLEALPGKVKINSPALDQRLVNNLHVTLANVDNERLIYELDEQRVMAASGSACNASSSEPSHVLKAMGKSQAEIRSSIRLTMGRSTTENDINYCLQVLAKLLA